MNERIKELAERAYGTRKHVPPVWQFYDSELEELVELVVRECLTQADKIRDSLEEDGEADQALGADWAALAIARHFGVE